MNKIIAVVSIFIVNIICILKKVFIFKNDRLNNTVDKQRYCSKPLFTSSFIQKWYAEDFTLERWLAELQMLKDIGIKEIILQSVADTKNKNMAYPTEISGYTSNKKDMLLLALDAAKAVGMKVRVGIAESDDWWEKGWNDYKWLIEEAEINKKIVNEIADKYSNHEAFGGWYITYEFSEFYAATKSQQKNLNLFYKSICQEIKKKRNLSIMISPFYNSNKYNIGCLRVWSKMVKGVLANTGIDIVALQDSVGAGFNSIDEIGRLFYYTKQATDSIGIRLFVDTETFIATDVGNISASQDQIYQRMMEVEPYVEGFVAFSINHYQNRNTEGQIDNYNEYKSYYNNE